MIHGRDWYTNQLVCRGCIVCLIHDIQSCIFCTSFFLATAHAPRLKSGSQLVLRDCVGGSFFNWMERSLSIHFWIKVECPVPGGKIVYRARLSTDTNIIFLPTQPIHSPPSSCLGHLTFKSNNCSPPSLSLQVCEHVNIEHWCWVQIR